MAAEKQNSLRFSRYYRQFSSNYAFTNRNLFLMALPLISVNLTLDYGRAPGSATDWLYVSLVGYFALFLAAFPLRWLFNAGKVPSAFYLISFFVLGFIRGVAIFLAGTSIGLIQSDEVLYRLVGSGIFVFCTLPISTILVSNFGRANNTLKELQAQTLRRTKRLNSMKLEIAEQKAEIAGRVSGLLMPVITDLIQRGNTARGSELDKQISALRSTVDTVVRPLSQSVVNEGTRLSDPQVQLDRASLLARLNPKTQLNVSELFLPGLSTFLVTLMCSSAMITFGGWQFGIPVLVSMALAIFLVLRFGRRISSGLRLSVIPAFAVTMLAYAAIAMLVILSVGLINSELLPIAGPRISSLILIFGFFFFIAQSRYQVLQQANAQLEEVNLELALLNAQAKQELWHNRRRIATVLHGPVQAALYASAIRLAQAKKPTKKLLQEVDADLADVMKALKFEQTEIIPVRDVIREIIEVWSGVCEIYFNIPKAVYDAAKRNSNVAESFVEIIREAISNAIKHGGADEIEVSAKLTRGVISLQVVNNGKAPSEKQASTGYGTQILNELALTWSLTRSASGKTVFTSEIVAAV